jgi:hypothetical protein
VRQIDCLPIAIIEDRSAHRAEISGLGEVAPEIEVVCRVGGVPKVEAPSEIQQEAFPPGIRQSARRRCGLCLGFLAAHGIRRSDHRGRNRHRQTGLKQVSTR